MRVLGAILTICSMLVFTSVQAMATDAGPRVLLQTSKGNITIELNEAKAPISVANFLTYVRDGHYAGTVFHRVIKGFMIQGGGLNKQLSEKITHASIRNEADNGLRNDRGTIAMARTGDPHSATSQFFINLVDNGFLNHRSKNGSGWGYAVFGKVIEGMDIVDAIAAVKTISRGPYKDVPAEPIIINKVTIVQ